MLHSILILCNLVALLFVLKVDFLPTCFVCPELYLKQYTSITCSVMDEGAHPLRFSKATRTSRRHHRDSRNFGTISLQTFACGSRESCRFFAVWPFNSDVLLACFDRGVDCVSCRFAAAENFDIWLRYISGKTSVDALPKLSDVITRPENLSFPGKYRHSRTKKYDLLRPRSLERGPRNR